VYGFVERVRSRKLQILGEWAPWGTWGVVSLAGYCLISNRMSGAVAASGRVILTRRFLAWSGCCSFQMGTDGGMGRRAAGGGGALLARKLAYRGGFWGRLWGGGKGGAGRGGGGAGGGGGGGHCWLRSLRTRYGF